MYIWKNKYKLLIIFFILLAFITCGCSQPTDDKVLPKKDNDSTAQIEQKKEEPQPEPPAPEPPAEVPQKPEVLEVKTPEPPAEKPADPEPVKPEVKEPAKPEPAKPEPVKPEPVPAQPAKKSDVADTIKMENPAYEKHKKGIVLFPHKNHVAEQNIGCGECHHDEKGTPLNNLKFGDKVANCIACHAKPGQAPRVKDKPKLTKEQKREYHAEAIHEKCITCHKEYKKKTDTKAAPTSCSKCHPKGE